MSRGTWIWAALPVLVALGCQEDGDGTCHSRAARSGEIAVYNDDCALDREVKRTHEDVPIDPAGEALPLLLAAASPPSATLTLLATVSPPVVRGMTLQASSVTLKGDYAVVTYMVAGEPAAGALDVIKTSKEDSPELVSRATFEYSDIIAADFDDGYVWFVGATPDRPPAVPAFLQAMKLQGYKLDAADSQRVDLPSYAGTSVSVSSARKIYATSGSQGGFFAYSFAREVFEKLYEYSMSDARGVHFRGDRIAVVTGMPGTLTVYEESKGTALGSYRFAGADVPEAKTTVEISDQKAFVAAGSAGVQVLSTETGALVASLARPDPRTLGLDPSVVVTNAVSVDGDLLFACNGQAGISVAQNVSKIDKGENLQLLGQLRLGDSNSANHVAYRGKYLMVATGLGGLKIVRVDTP